MKRELDKINICIDYSEALNDVKPIDEHWIESLASFMQVKNPIGEKEPPHSIMFMVPVKEKVPADDDHIINTFFEESTNEPLIQKDVEVKQFKYVRVDNMPLELKNVVQTYVFCLKDEFPMNTTTFKHFKDNVKKLYESLNELCEDDNETVS